MKERYKTMVNTLFNVNPNKFKEVAKNITLETVYFLTGKEEEGK